MANKVALIDDVYSAIKNEEDRREDTLKETPKLDALMALPYPTLGALEGCLGWSLLSPFCRAYVNNLSDDATQKANAEIKAQIAANKAQMNKVFCFALEAITPSPSSD